MATARANPAIEFFEHHLATDLLSECRSSFKFRGALTDHLGGPNLRPWLGAGGWPPGHHLLSAWLMGSFCTSSWLPCW